MLFGRTSGRDVWSSGLSTGRCESPARSVIRRCGPVQGPDDPMRSGFGSADVNRGGCPRPVGSGILRIDWHEVPLAVAPREPEGHHASWIRFPVPKLD